MASRRSAIARDTVSKCVLAVDSSPCAPRAATEASTAACSEPSRVIRLIFSMPRRQPRRMASSCDSRNVNPTDDENANAAAARSGSCASARSLERCFSSAAPSTGFTHESIAQHTTLPSAPGSSITLPRFPSVLKSTGRRSALLKSASNAARTPSVSNSTSPRAVPLPPCSRVGPLTNSRTATGSARASPASIAARRSARLALSSACCARTTPSGMPAFCRRSARE